MECRPVDFNFIVDTVFNNLHGCKRLFFLTNFDTQFVATYRSMSLSMEYPFIVRVMAAASGVCVIHLDMLEFASTLWYLSCFSPGILSMTFMIWKDLLLIGHAVMIRFVFVFK